MQACVTGIWLYFRITGMLNCFSNKQFSAWIVSVMKNLSHPAPKILKTIIPLFQHM
jgi:hypothetical protein